VEVAIPRSVDALVELVVDGGGETAGLAREVEPGGDAGMFDRPLNLAHDPLQQLVEGGRPRCFGDLPEAGDVALVTGCECFGNKAVATAKVEVHQGF